MKPPSIITNGVRPHSNSGLVIADNTLANTLERMREADSLSPADNALTEDSLVWALPDADTQPASTKGFQHFIGDCLQKLFSR